MDGRLQADEVVSLLHVLRGADEHLLLLAPLMTTFCFSSEMEDHVVQDQD